MTILLNAADFGCICKIAKNNY